MVNVKRKGSIKGSGKLMRDDCKGIADEASKTIKCDEIALFEGRREEHSGYLVTGYVSTGV